MYAVTVTQSLSAFVVAVSSNLHDNFFLHWLRGCQSEKLLTVSSGYRRQHDSGHSLIRSQIMTLTAQVRSLHPVLALLLPRNIIINFARNGRRNFAGYTTIPESAKCSVVFVSEVRLCCYFDNSAIVRSRH